MATEAPFPKTQCVALAMSAPAPYADAELVSERLAWEERASSFEPPDVLFTDLTIGGVEAEEATCAGACADRTMLYLHGGAFVAGSKRTHRRVTAALARRRFCRVFALNYRLAPEHSFPAAINDALAAVADLQSPLHEPSKLILAGDSAGGGLVLATMLALRDRRLPQPSCAWAISPWADLTRTVADFSRFQPDPVLDPRSLVRAASLYVGRHDAGDPLISPANGDYRELAPILLQVGAREMLIADAFAVAQASALANVSATLEILPDMDHSYVLTSGLDPRADQYIDQASAWIAARTQR